jgi:large subunit ribosomal protein L32
VSVCSKCGEHKRPHHVCEKCGTYNGRQILTVKE